MTDLLYLFLPTFILSSVCDFSDIIEWTCRPLFTFPSSETAYSEISYYYSTKILSSRESVVQVA